MLNQKVCLECWTVVVKHANWKENIIDCWKKGRIYCPLECSYSKGIQTEAKIKLDPPQSCPYILEHLVANRQEEIDKKELTNA